MATISQPEFKGFYTEYEARSNNPEDIVGDLRNLVACYKVVRLLPGWHIHELRNFYDLLAEGLGKPVDIAENYAQAGVQTGERWMEIRYDANVPDLAAYRHSKNAQPLHTDNSYIANPCDVLVFYCENRAARGGDTLFVDGEELVARMRVVDPYLLEQLSMHDVVYEKSSNKRTDKIINLENLSAPIFNFNYFCIAPGADDEQKSLNAKFFNFLETHVKGSYLERPVHLNPGEGVFWWDHFVVHGRNPFSADKTNDRLIWKTGIKWA